MIRFETLWTTDEIVTLQDMTPRKVRDFTVKGEGYFEEDYLYINFRDCAPNDEDKMIAAAIKQIKKSATNWDEGD